MPRQILFAPSANLDEDIVKNAIGSAIRKLRKQHRLTQGQVAELAGLHRTFYGNLERGVHSVSVFNLIKISKSIGCEPEDVFNLAKKDY